MAGQGKEKKLSELTGAAVRALRLSHFTIERAPVIVLWLDEDGAIRRVNERGSEVLGRPRDALEQLRFHDLVAEDADALWRELWRASPKDGALEAETVLRRGDGLHFPVDIAISCVEFEDQPINCAFLRDISERRRAEDALRDALGDVERLKNKLQAENVYLRDEIQTDHNFDEIIGSSPLLKRTLYQVEQVADSDATVLVLGESGTGKELIARAVHGLSPRRGRPLVKVNCAALPANLIESELFGHEKGAFTGAVARRAGRFELADQGTLFLDEVGEMPVELQTKLLRVLQEGELERLGGSETLKVDVRVIAATNRALEQAVEAGEFRADLYYRLNVFPVNMPALRERPEDIGPLALHFAHKYGTKQGKPAAGISGRMLEAMSAYHWPGNVRELENVIERAVILQQGDTLELARPLGATPTTDATTDATADAPRTMREVEVATIKQALEATGWVIGGKRGAARRLDMPVTTLRDRIERYRLVRGG